MKTQLTAETHQAPAGLLIFTCTCLLLMHPKPLVVLGLRSWLWAPFATVQRRVKPVLADTGSPQAQACLVRTLAAYQLQCTQCQQLNAAQFAVPVAVSGQPWIDCEQDSDVHGASSATSPRLCRMGHPASKGGVEQWASTTSMYLTQALK